MVAKASNRQLILLRHAHRDLAGGPLSDNSISSLGAAQAKTLVGSLGKTLESPTFFSSPKMRCQQTLEPLVQQFGLKINVEPDLDEQGSSESREDFLSRLKRVRQRWESSGGGDWVFCSHGDWIPEFYELMTGRPTAIEKAQWIILRSGKRG